MNTKVVGVTFSNEDGSSRERIIANMTPSDKVIIERDPMNQYDSNAVKVCVIKDGSKQQIGFVERNLAAMISPKLRRGTTYNVSVVNCGIYMSRAFCEINIQEEKTTAPVDKQEQSRPAARPTSRPSSRPNQQTTASAAPQMPKQVTTPQVPKQTASPATPPQVPKQAAPVQPQISRPAAPVTQSPVNIAQQPVKKEKKGFFSRIAAFFKGE